MSTRAGRARATPDWLALREPADAAARSTGLVHQLARGLSPSGTLTVHDLGCGTGAMLRWLAPRLPGPQHWVLCDRDADLLGVAATRPLPRATDGSAVTMETRRVDVTRMSARQLATGGLVTASALLDVLTTTELERLVDSCVHAGCPVLLNLTVTGRVRLDPPDRWDQPISEAFNAHQQRPVGGHRLLGPGAVRRTIEAFTARGAEVTAAASPWRLGHEDSALTAAWFDGWLAAALEQRPELAGPTLDYVRRRRGQAAAGRLTATVDHRDLLARPDVEPAGARSR
jgi:trans-aconitate methyltransferase